ncbi:MAG: sensor histidine kinase [Gemmatimonadales bacterium]
MVYATAEPPGGAPDAEVTLFGLAITEANPDLGPATWTFFGNDGAASAASPWRLRAWVRRGALEDAIRGTGYGSVALAVATTLLLAIAAAYAVAQSRRAEAAATVRAAILAGVSHELRTPLSVIRSAAENLDGGLVDARAAVEYGQLIGREADRLIDSVEATLRLARGAANGAGAASELVSLDELVAEAAQALESDHRIRIAGPSGASLRGDREALRVAVTNLLSNALRYSPAGAPVELRVDASADEIAIRVADQGPGFASDERELVFEPFRRGRAGASSPQGAGLGLTLVREIARAHGGRVTIADGRSGGGVVTLHLPTDA